MNLIPPTLINTFFVIQCIVLSFFDRFLWFYIQICTDWMDNAILICIIYIMPINLCTQNIAFVSSFIFFCFYLSVILNTRYKILVSRKLDIIFFTCTKHIIIFYCHVLLIVTVVIIIIGLSLTIKILIILWNYSPFIFFFFFLL